MSLIMTLIAAICIFIASSLAQANDRENDLGRAKTAEMKAFIEQALEACHTDEIVPRQWVIEAIMIIVLTDPPLTDDEIIAKSQEVTRLRSKLGLDNWCTLFAVNMKEAHLVMQTIGIDTDPFLH